MACMTWRTMAESSTTRTCRLISIHVRQLFCPSKPHVRWASLCTPRLSDAFVPNLPIDGRLQAAQLGGHAVQIFGVANKQHSIGCELTDEVRDHPALGIQIKINQDVAAENGVERSFAEIDIGFWFRFNLRKSTICWISTFTFISACRSAVPRNINPCSKSLGSSPDLE
jgi:hypothetical protein